jgi:sigma-54 dependent transcriptional regulator, acetoin dehydrogenase operon transcriptional activator AcoR
MQNMPWKAAITAMPVIPLPRLPRRHRMEILRRHHWPGNVRELRNVLERAAMVCPHGGIRPEHLNLLPPSSPPTHAPAKPTLPVVPRRPTLEEVERKMILDAWEYNSHHLEKTARELGIAIATLKRRLKTFKAEHLIPS